MDVKEQIRKYRWGLEDWELVGSIFESATMQEVFAVLAEMIRTDFQIENRDNAFYKAVEFIEDVGRTAPREIRKPFRAYLVRSRLLKQMRALLFSDNPSTRKSVLHALDKLTIKSNGDFFEKVFYRFYATDPLWTPHLLTALSWVGRREVDLNAVYQHPNYLVRWPVLSRHGHFSTDDAHLLARKRRELELYLQDANAWIRAEAEHHYREMVFDEQWPTMTKQENRQRRKEIDKLEPKIDWDFVSLRFGTLLAQSSRDSYTLYELDAFVQELAKENG